MIKCENDDFNENYKIMEVSEVMDMLSKYVLFKIRSYEGLSTLNV